MEVVAMVENETKDMMTIGVIMLVVMEVDLRLTMVDTGMPCMVVLDMQVLGTLVTVGLLAMVEVGVLEVVVVVEPLEVMVAKDMVGQLEALVEVLLLVDIDMDMDTGMTVVKGTIMAAMVVPGVAAVVVEGGERGFVETFLASVLNGRLGFPASIRLSNCIAGMASFEYEESNERICFGFRSVRCVDADVRFWEECGKVFMIRYGLSLYVFMISVGRFWEECGKVLGEKGVEDEGRKTHLLEDKQIPSVGVFDEVFLALGWHLEEIHMTWAHLEKKQTRLQTYTKSLDESFSQSVETASHT
ncbi:hypothetical protein Tco_1090711 [Tanacetum coccineum]|uniref:Uncharacterized protein n=1 Tax=Tanacetum coccineum TaxID=301880 RepID=A0ABQ5I4Z1_9ASTR